MKLFRSRSLRTRLIVRLVLVQALALFVAGTIAVALITSFFGVDGQVAHPRDAAIVDEALVYDGDDLTVVLTEELEDLIAQAPGLWFFAQDLNGQTVSHGDVPAAYQSIIENLTAFDGSAAMRAMDFDSGLSSAMRVSERSGSRIHILVGGGRSMDLLSAIATATNRLLFFLFIVLAITTMLAVTWIVRREVSAVETVAAQAATIDFDQRGLLLTEAGLPKEVAPLVRAFNSALMRLDDGYARQKRFLTAAAHELKTPIAIMQTRIETSVTGPEQGLLLLDAARLSTLAEQLLDLERVEHGKTDFADIDLVALARQVTADCAPLAIVRGYEISFETAIDTHRVIADPPALERTLTNLIQNAIAHGGGRGVIGVSVSEDGAIEVADDGPGVPEPERDAIFEPFYRVSPHAQGSGLGLSLVKDILRLHGGKIQVAGSASGGAIFRVVVPAASGDSAAITPASRT